MSGPQDDRNPLQKAQERLSAVASTFVDSSKPKLWASATTSNESGGSDIIFPAFDDLPDIPGQPKGCLWGFWDKDGKKDEIGALNMLTPSVVKAASAEIRTGEHVQLDWSLDNLQFPAFGRKKLEHKILDVAPPFPALDDEITLNTQSGSQWDGLKHVGSEKSMMYYNGLPHDVVKKVWTNGIHNWCDRGGVVGRGVLVDWLRWYEQEHGNPPNPTQKHSIPISELEATLRYQGTTTRPGDILLVRSGFVKWHDYASEEERKAIVTKGFECIGVETSESTIRWLYSRHFAAVAGDACAFEAWPPTKGSPWSLHFWLLSQWGTPIGEFWNLERLSKKCEKHRKWTFFFTSAPLNIKGGVASPPCAIAVL